MNTDAITTSGLASRELANRGGDFRGRGHERGDEDRDDRVARIRVGQRLERPAVVVGGGGRDHVDRVAQRRARGQELGQPGSDVGRQLRDLHPGRLAGVGAQDPGAAPVGDDHDPVPARDGLRRQQRGDVEQLVHRVGPNHARLLEQRIDGHVRGRQHRAGMRRGRAGARGGPSALDRQDRLGGRHPAGDARELPGVAE